MANYFNGVIVENLGVRTISGGGTNATNASQALANLSGVSLLGNQTISGNKTFANDLTVSGVLSFSGVSYALNFWHAVTNGANSGDYFFTNLMITPSTASGNRFLTVMESGMARKASWTQLFNASTGSEGILNSTGYFVNISSQQSGIINSGIRCLTTGQSYNFTGAINPPVQVSAGDKVNVCWKVPSYTGAPPGSAYNSVDVYFYSK